MQKMLLPAILPTVLYEKQKTLCIIICSIIMVIIWSSWIKPADISITE